MSIIAATDSTAPEPHVIPTLTDRVEPERVPLALQAVLQGRLAEKSQLDEMAVHLMEQLRPQVEQMVTQTVRNAMRSAWLERAEKYDEFKR